MPYTYRSGTYRLTYRCTNCGAVTERDLDRGSLAPPTIACANCGCRTAHPLGWTSPRRATMATVHRAPGL